VVYWSVHPYHSITSECQVLKPSSFKPGSTCTTPSSDRNQGSTCTTPSSDRNQRFILVYHSLLSSAQTNQGSDFEPGSTCSVHPAGWVSGTAHTLPPVLNKPPRRACHSTDYRLKVSRFIVRSYKRWGLDTPRIFREMTTGLHFGLPYG